MRPPKPSPVKPERAAPVVPAPRFAMAWAALVYALATLALAYPMLDGQFLVNPYSDEYIAGYAFREFGASMLRETGSFPLWNPYLFGGMPFVAAMHGDIFYPIFLVRLVLETDTAMSLTFAIHLLLAGLFTYGFLRAAGLGFFPALIGGLAYMLGGPIAGYASPGHDGKLYVSALFPLALWLLLRGVRDGRAWAWGPLALTVGLAVLSPHPQLLQYMLLAGGAFALFLAFANGVAMPRKIALRRLAIALAMVGLGGAMGAIQYLPVREYVEWSPRAGGLPSYEVAVSYSMPPEELINTYLPQFSGIVEAYGGRNPIHLHSDYLGAVVLLLAGAAFLGGRRNRFFWFWTATLAVTLLWAMGGFTPFYRIVYALVPGTKYFRAPSTILYIVAFSVAVLAAHGVANLLERRIGVRYLVGWVVGAVVVALLATSGGLTNIALTIAPDARYDVVMANRPALVLGAWRSFLFVALAAGLAIAYLRGKLSVHAAGYAMAAVLAVDLWSVARHYWRFMPRAEVIYASDPALDYVKQQDQPGRVLALNLGPTEAVNDPFLNGDALMSHRIRQVLGYHGNELGRYQLLHEGYRQLANPNFWQLTNLRFLLTNVAESPLPGANRVVGPVVNAAGSTVYLYRLPGENPAAWVVPAILKAPDELVYNTVLNPQLGPALRQVALFDTAAPVTARPLDSLPQPLALDARVLTYEPGHIAVALGAPAPEGSALLVSENYYPGWQASVDGRPAPIGRAHFTLIGVQLPEGARSVQLTFRSRPYELGKIITLLALGATGLLVVWGLLIEGRRRVGIGQP